MGTCQYEYNGVKTCNIDTGLFKDSNQEDLFSDYCYFHQIGEIFDYAQRVLKDRFSEIKIPINEQTITLQDANKIKQILLFLLVLRLNIPSDKVFYDNFHELMEDKQPNLVNISGFYLPVVKKETQNFIVLNASDEQLNWNNIFVWQNISGYSIDYIDTKIGEGIVSRVFSQIIGNTLLTIYRKKQAEAINNFPRPDMSEPDFNNLTDFEIAKNIPYEQEDVKNIHLKEILNNILSASPNEEVEKKKASSLNDIFKSIISTIIKDMDIEKVLGNHSNATQEAVVYIKSVLQGMAITDIKEYIDMDIQVSIYRNIANSNSNFHRFLNDLQNYGFLGDIKEIPVKFQNIIFNGDVKTIGDQLYKNYVFENCEFNSQSIDITAPILEFYKNSINDKNQILTIITDNTSIKNCKEINSNKIVIYSADLKISNTYFTNNVIEIELAVRFFGLKLSYPFSEEKPLFCDTTKIDIYDGYNSHSYTEREEGQGLLQYVNLKNVRFHECNKNEVHQEKNYENLNQLSFVHCEFNGGHKLYEDANIDVFSQDDRAGILKRLEYNYRYLRKYYDEKGDYIEGNDFHYNYMEAKRNNTENAWDRFLLGLYEGLNGYNTKPEKTFWILVLLVLTSSLVIFCLGEFDIKDSTIYTSKDNHHYAFSLLYAFSNLVPLINSDLFVPKNWISVLVKLVENISSPILVTFFVMALRNRFRRSKSEDEFK